MLEAGFEDCGGISLRCRLCRMFVSSVCVGVAGISFEGEGAVRRGGEVREQSRAATVRGEAAGRIIRRAAAI